MAKERRKIEQTRHRIDACTVPTEQGAYGKRMTKTVQVRWCDASWNRELKSRKQIVEGLTDRIRSYGGSLLLVEGEHRVVRWNAPAAGFFTLQENCNGTGHSWPERYKTIFAKFCLANDQELVSKVDVLAAQPRYFSYAKPQTIQQGEDHPVDFSACRCSWIAGE